MSFLYCLRELINYIFNTPEKQKGDKKYRRLVASFCLRKKIDHRGLTQLTPLEGNDSERKKTFIIIKSLNKMAMEGKVRESEPPRNFFESPYQRRKRSMELDDINPPKKAKISGVSFSRPLDLKLVYVDRFMEVLGEPTTYEQEAKMEVLFDRSWYSPSSSKFKYEELLRESEDPSEMRPTDDQGGDSSEGRDSATTEGENSESCLMGTIVIKHNSLFPYDPSIIFNEGNVGNDGIVENARSEEVNVENGGSNNDEEYENEEDEDSVENGGSNYDDEYENEEDEDSVENGDSNDDDEYENEEDEGRLLEKEKKSIRIVNLTHREYVNTDSIEEFENPLPCQERDKNNTEPEFKMSNIDEQNREINKANYNPDENPPSDFTNLYEALSEMNISKH